MATSVTQYENLWKNFKSRKDALQASVGGDFEVVGKLELEFLKSIGLRPDWSVIDVGCGSGRLTVQLADYLTGPYLGTDVLPALLENARQISGRPEWRFELTAGEGIPAPDGGADLVCFFSVATHIAHEETWRYLLEAKRVLKPGGRIVVSFLEFRIRSHWAIFREDVKDRTPQKVLNQFLSRDAFEAFALNSGLRILNFFDGDRPHIPIEGELVFANGHRVSGLGNLGQSICVIEKPVEPLAIPD